jgi:predicted nucleic acid-binding protein
MILFDASAMINLFRDGRVQVLLQGCTIDLAAYELGSAVRRYVKVEKTLANSDGVELLKALQNVMSAMENVQIMSLVPVLENAIKENLSFYDASYLTAATEGGYRLVADDEGLLQAARKYLDVSKSSDLA